MKHATTLSFLFACFLGAAGLVSCMQLSPHFRQTAIDRDNALVTGGIRVENHTDNDLLVLTHYSVNNATSYVPAHSSSQMEATFLCEPTQKEVALELSVVALRQHAVANPPIDAGHAVKLSKKKARVRIDRGTPKRRGGETRASGPETGDYSRFLGL